MASHHDVGRRTREEAAELEVEVETEGAAAVVMGATEVVPGEGKATYSKPRMGGSRPPPPSRVFDAGRRVG
jgi:hypothetical protein